MPNRLRDKVAVVVGGTSGIGRALALGFADAGADVVASGRRGDLVNETADAIESRGRRSLRQTCDIEDPVSLTKLRDECLETLGSVDVLVAAAGTTKRVPSIDMADADWQRILSINLTGTWQACRVFGAAMVAPMTWAGETRGVIGVGTRVPGRVFTDTDADALTTFETVRA